MSSRALNPTPSWGRTVEAQVRMVALLQRRDFLILGVVAAGLIGLALWGYTKLPATIDTDDLDILPVFPALAFPLAAIAALWPLGVWRRDEPGRRGYFWSLPVAQGPHTLLRVAAGWLLLMCVCVAVMALALGIVAPVAARYEEIELSFAAWWAPLVLPTLPYVLVSVLAVAFENPIRFVAWVVAAGFGAAMVIEVMDLQAAADLAGSVTESFGAALGAPVLTAFDEWNSEVRWAPHYLMWFGIGAVLLVLTAFWRREAS
jgi:hypothetical protein